MSFRLWYKAFQKNRLAIVGMVIIIIFMILALFGQWIMPYNPIEQNYAALLKPPSLHHLMGTDQLGEDVFSRVVYGARFALLIGFGVVLMEGIIGVSIGTISGYFGGVLDNLLMRVADTVLSIPAMVLAIIIAGSFGGGVLPLIITMVIISWAYFARIVRGQVLREKERTYIEAEKAIGASNIHILWKHLLPNTIAIVVVYSTLEIPWAILFSAGMSFLGVGIQPPTPAWGSIIAGGRNYLTTAWWITTFPGLVLMLVVLGFNFLGDGLRDALDPRLVRKK